MTIVGLCEEPVANLDGVLGSNPIVILVDEPNLEAFIQVCAQSVRVDEMVSISNHKGEAQRKVYELQVGTEVSVVEEVYELRAPIPCVSDSDILFSRKVSPSNLTLLRLDSVVCGLSNPCSLKLTIHGRSRFISVAVSRRSPRV